MINIGSRINRITYFGLSSFWFTFIVVISVLTRNTHLIACGLGIIIFLIASLLIEIKRLHDFNFSGWWVLLVAVPIIGWLFALAIFVMPGTKGRNKYGEQPLPARWYYKLLSLTIPAIFASMIILNYSGLSAKYLVDWQPYQSLDYSVQLPASPEVSNNELLNVPFEHLSSTSKDDRILFTIDVINYHEVNLSTLNAFTQDMGLKALSDLLTIQPEMIVKNIFLTNKKITGIQILSNERVKNSPIPGRLLLAKFSDGTDRYVKSAIYLDDKNKKFYIVAAFYSDNYKMDIDSHVVDNFFSSLKLKPHKVIYNIG